MFAVKVTVVDVVRLRCSVRSACSNKNVAMSLWSLLGAKTLVTPKWLSATYLQLLVPFTVFGLNNERKTN